MSHKTFVRSVVADVAVGALVASGMIGLSLVAPAWVVGAVCIFLAPLLVVGVLAVMWRQSRRRDQDRSSLGADHALTEAPQTPAAAPATGRGAAIPPGRPARPDVVTAYVDLAWATADMSLRSWKRTRPGR